LSNNQGRTEKLGQIGPVTTSYVCLRTDEGLLALHPVSGTVLWTKTDLSADTQIFGDDENIYLIDVHKDNSITNGRAVRGRDGTTLNVRDFASEYRHRQRLVGGRLFLSEHEPTGGMILRLYDIPGGKDVWKKVVPPSAVVLNVEDAELAGFVEPNGKLTVI